MLWQMVHNIGALRVNYFLKTKNTILFRMIFVSVHLVRTDTSLEALGGFEPPNQSFADSCLTTWLQRHFIGAGNGAQTRDLCLGKAALYQLSYSRISYILVVREGIEPPTRGFSVPCSTDWAIWPRKYGDLNGARTHDL